MNKWTEWKTWAPGLRWWC